jgi:hypothetical protein
MQGRLDGCVKRVALVSIQHRLNSRQYTLMSLWELPPRAVNVDVDEANNLFVKTMTEFWNTLNPHILI